MLHYNFPPYSVGETGRMSSPGRREIGHGKLAWRAIHPVLPPKENFPYTIRTVVEITESNGSSSMATVCGTSLALMDAGVPISKPVAGIAMGLIKEQEAFVVLSDILGDEDHLGDMDFKVAGTDSGITALQMDIKVTGINHAIMKVALEQAHQGRLHILGEMQKALEGVREEISAHAPRIETLTIRKEKIRDVIGTGGKVIREICDTTGAKIDISDDGVVQVSGPNLTSIEAAIERIINITAEPEMGMIYKAKVVKMFDYGVLVEFLGSRSGLLHISQMSEQRVEKVEDVVKMGDELFVKLTGFDERGRAKLSMKKINQETGDEGIEVETMAS
jgi:polyribonucleotide nucleotidyltransferase